MPKIFIGTSGFSYKHWQGLFYPQDLRQKDWLRYYAKHFDTVEINATFYRQMKPQTFKKWRAIVDDDFVFSIKASRFITHIKKLKDCQEPLERFMRGIEQLNNAAIQQYSNVTMKQWSNRTIVLFQLPPRWQANTERLKDFVKLLPKDFRFAFEFRDKSWLNSKIYKILGGVNCALVIQDSPHWPTSEEITADFTYLRFHGSKKLYSSCYTEKELKSWARKIKNWLKDGLDVYVYFNNDALGYAVENARTLKELVS